MSHDRGCSCGREKYEYDECNNITCPHKEKHMTEVTRVEGYKTSDNRIFISQDEANHHQKYLNITKALCDILEDRMTMDDRYARLAASIMAEHKHEVYNILKSNL
jgi:dsDNA-binding SOS-regulon protein